MPISPVVTAGFSKHLYQKDTKFTNGDESKAKFICNIVLDPSDPAQDQFIKERIAAHKAAGGSKDNCPIKPGLKDHKYQDPALYYGKLKTGYKPVIVDTANQDITDTGVKVFGGDSIRVMFKEIKDSPIKGCFLRLQKVQLVAKNSDDGGDFDDIDGFKAGGTSQVADNSPADDDDEDF